MSLFLFTFVIEQRVKLHVSKISHFENSFKRPKKPTCLIASRLFVAISK